MKRSRLMPSGNDGLSALFGTLCLLSSPALAQGPERLLMFGPVQAVNARLDSLEQIALHTPNPATRASALIRLTEPGIVWALHREPAPIVVYPGIVARLQRIYPSADSYSRGMIVRGLSVQAERSEALTWLRELTRSTDMSDGHIGIAEEAVEALAKMGPGGEAELRRLHLSGEADPGLQKMLDRLARTGYRHRPGG